MHASEKWVIWELAVSTIVIALLAALGHPLLFPVEWHRLLHVAGAILLVGNIVVTGVWMVLAERTRQPDVLRFAVRAVSWADAFFTVPGILLLVANGDVLAEPWGGAVRVSWIAASLALFALSGAVWVGLLLRYQHRLIALSAAPPDGTSAAETFAVLHRWYFWGSVATLLPCISLVLMFLKPRLW